MTIEKEFDIKDVKELRKFIRHYEFPTTEYDKPVVEKFFRVILKNSMHVMDYFKVETRKDRDAYLQYVERKAVEFNESSILVEGHANYRVFN